MAVYELLGIDREIPPVTPHDKSIHTQIKALIKAFEFECPSTPASFALQMQFLHLRRW